MPEEKSQTGGSGQKSEKPSGSGRRRNRNRNRNRNRGGDKPGAQGAGQKPQGRGRGSKSGGRSKKSNADRPVKKMGKIIESLEPKTFGVVFYDTLMQAKASLPDIEKRSSECDQLNIIIKAEADMNDPELLQYGVVFAGEAWHLIHTRRMEEGWYEKQSTSVSDKSV